MIGTIIVLAVAGYLLACLLAGFGDAGTLRDFEPHNRPLVRRFAQPVDRVMSAYRSAIPSTPGLRQVDQADGEMLLDLRPTTRVLGGNFGLVIRLRFHHDGPGTRLVAESRNKVPFAIRVNDQAAFQHAERAVRMRAKRAGLDEVIVGLR
jgi:hypothetical protein